jgi:hypothetical protein
VFQAVPLAQLRIETPVGRFAVLVDQTVGKHPFLVAILSAPKETRSANGQVTHAKSARCQPRMGSRKSPLGVALRP